MSRYETRRILWINDAGDLEKISAWLAFRRAHITSAIAIEHEDSDAVSICFYQFNGDEGGIVRCANDDLTDTALEIIEPIVDVVFHDSDPTMDSPDEKRFR